MVKNAKQLLELFYKTKKIISNLTANNNNHLNLKQVHTPNCSLCPAKAYEVFLLIANPLIFQPYN